MHTKPTYKLILFFFLILFTSVASHAQNASKTYLGVPTSEIKTALESHLKTWYPTIIDTLNGGYWTNFEYDWTRSKDQQKMLVTQARGLWTAARAASTFPENPVYKDAAQHGFQFLTTKMWDDDNGGFYQNFTTSEYKLIYGNTFALFALSEYAKINKNPAVLQWVKKVFEWMEKAAHDSTYFGYYNIILSDSIKKSKTPETEKFIAQIGWGDPTWKDQNTSIHILEALTTTYQVLPEPLVKKRLEEMLQLVRDKMVNPEGHLNLYFKSDWKPIIHRDSSRAFILKNLNYDHISFGHDIETAYLLLDASKALYGKYDSKTLRVAKQLVDHSLAHGFEKDYYGIFDRGYRFTKNGKVEIVNRSKAWWSQAEAWHSLALMASIYPKEKAYTVAFQKMWRYIQTELVDVEHGGWYGNGLDENPESKTQRKAHQWKGAYHDGRALLQVWSYANE